MIYNMDSDPNGHDPVVIQLKDLPSNYNVLRFLIDDKFKDVIVEQQLSFKAGKLIGTIYDALKPRYKMAYGSENVLKSLNKLCVRLVFCLYAEDAGLFDPNDNHVFGNYLKRFEAQDIRVRLKNLFTVLDQKPEERDLYLEDDDPQLAKFPYVDGNLFKFESKETDEIPSFTEEIKHLLVTECSESLDWSKISPTIFGALFESTLNQVTRRTRGMHYTSVENIHKVIDPLFLDDLKAELEKIKATKNAKKKEADLIKFQNKLASLKFLDPACGSGNFLTETYLCIRRLENDLIRAYTDMAFLESEDFNPIKVSINQFYGIEINDFAVAVANTALWIAESQMLQETESIIKRSIDYLPLKSNSNIIHGNALRIDWNGIVSNSELSYIIGNPPFVGQSRRTAEQSEDMYITFGKGNPETKLDYVLCWFRKSLDYLKGTPSSKIKVSFVATNSICQGESVAVFWKKAVADGAEIGFAYDSFKWINESKNLAQVMCVILGFSNGWDKKQKIIFNDNGMTLCEHISPYLKDENDFWISSRGTAAPESCPKIIKGSEPSDGGHLFFNLDERNALIKKYPILEKCIRPFVGGDEFLNSKAGVFNRWCLWALGFNTAEFSKIREIRERLEQVKQTRLQSTPDNRISKSAEYPYLFCQIRQPAGSYLIFPRHTTDNRKYIPIAYLNPDVIVGDACYIIPDAALHLFAILISVVHMKWIKMVCGRLGKALRYSPSVYNNFPWLTPDDRHKAKLEKTARGILAARDKFPENSLAELYMDDEMPPELKKAHRENDNAVLELYGLGKNASEEEIIRKLIDMHAEKTA